jgi:hypothetical protein
MRLPSDFEKMFQDYKKRIKVVHENLNEKIIAVISIVEVIKEIISTSETEVLHSTFDTKESLINELDTHIVKLSCKDFSKIKDLIILFSPTSDLQEISLDSGWGEQFLFISERFDTAIKELVDEFNLKPFSNSI